jgi:voltage-gated potassium channel
MTIGYGDLVPVTSLGRLLSLVIGFVGLLTTGLLVAVSLQAVRTAFEQKEANSPPKRKGGTA